MYQEKKLNSSKRRFFISNVLPKRVSFFGGSSDLEPIKYKNYEIPSLEQNSGIFVDLKSNLSELEELLGQMSYLNKEIKNIIKK